MGIPNARGYFDVDGLVLCICLLVGVGLILLPFMVSTEDKKWQEYQVAHHCKVVSKVDGSMFNTYGLDSKGRMTIGIGSTGTKTGWLCDDGITYYK